MPTASAGLSGIASGSDGALWFTEYMADKIGRIDPSSGAITEYALAAGSRPYGITSGPDGALWFTESTANRIGRIDPSTGAITEYAIPTTGSDPSGITSGPDGKVWFTEDSGNKIGRITPGTGTIVEYAIPTAASAPAGIVTGPDGNVWFTESSGSADQIAKIDPTTGAITEFAIPSFGGSTARPLAITVGSDGNLWFAGGQGNRVGRVLPASGAITQYSMPNAASFPNAITAGGDGRLWFTQQLGNRVASIDPQTAVIGQTAIPTASSFPSAIAAGPDGNLWFTEQGANKIGRLTLAYRLAVTRDGSGSGTVASTSAAIDCGATCSADLDGGSHVTLTARAASGSTFAGWGGDCTGTADTCTVSMQRARSVTATFTTVAASGAAETAAVAATPRVSAVLIVSQKRVRSGQSLRVGVRVSSAGGPAAAVRACLTLPKELVVVRLGSARQTGRRVCFAPIDLSVGAPRTRYVTVRAISSRRAVAVLRASALVPDGAGSQRDRQAIIVLPHGARPVPVTG